MLSSFKVMRMRNNHIRLIVAIILAMTIVTVADRTVQLIAVVLLAAIAVFDVTHRRASTFRMTLVATDAINEVLLLECKVSGDECLFMIDTGYAGPPVLSASYLAVDDPVHLSLEKRYLQITDNLKPGKIASDRQHDAIDKLISSSRCLSYTSGCTMRLMGIGSTQEQQADMLMCDMLQIRTTDGNYAEAKRDSTDAHADVFVTNPLPSSVHILTSDFLLHLSPCLLEMNASKNSSDRPPATSTEGRLRLNMNVDEELVLQSRMYMHKIELSGGSFVVPFVVAGHEFKCTVDTGAPGPLCLGAQAAKQVRKCVQGGHTVNQTGVNAEDVCSEIISTTLSFCGEEFAAAPIFINSLTTDHIDGYVGMAFLRAFDILITTSGIGFARNGLPMKTYEHFMENSHKGVCPALEMTCGT